MTDYGRQPVAPEAPAPSTVLVVNTQSRRGARLFHAARKELKRAGVGLSASYPIRKQADLIRAVDAAVKDEATRRIVVGGGDGTISTVADAIAYREITLGVLPLGTGNDFTRIMGIPLDLPGACRVVADGDVRPVSLAQVNGRYFLSTVLIGSPAHLNHSVPSWLKRIFGKTAYALYASLALLRPHPFHATLNVDGVRHVLSTTIVVIGNTRFHSPTRALPPAAVGDPDQLIVQVPRDAKLTTLLRLAFGFARNGHLDPNLLLNLSGREVLVEADPPQEVDADGEFVSWTPARASFAADALRVVLPPATPDAEAAEPHLAA